MELVDTIDLMTSEDYSERFVAEYAQVVIRYLKLNAMLERWDKGELDFTPSCPKETYVIQNRIMLDYISVLQSRATMEGVTLPAIEIHL